MPYPLTIALSGYAHVGKTTVAKMLVDGYGFERISFARRLKEMAVNGYPIGGTTWYWDGVAKGPLERANLQYIGDCERAKDPLVFVWPVIRALGEATGPVVIDDLRLHNEYVNIAERGAKVWRITKPNTGPVNAHHSETAHLDWEPDGCIPNDGTLDALRIVVAHQLARVSGAG